VTDAAPDPLIGTILNGKYLLERLVGSGGFGVVYAARHVLINELRAIKLLRVEGMRDKEGVITRFFREAKVGITLSHPGIVRVFELEMWGATPYLVMELLEGESLRERLREKGRLSAAETCGIGIAVADALAAAHALNVLHRDLKPDNVHLGPKGSVKLLDFGVAHFGSGASKVTKTGTFLGTPRFMSIEQVMSMLLDPRADVYAVGLLLYCCVAGKKPFADLEEDMAICAAIARGVKPIENLRELVPGLPEKLLLIIERATETDRERRFATMVELKQALDDCLLALAGSPAAEPAPTPAPRSMQQWDVHLPATVAVPPTGPSTGPSTGPGGTVRLDGAELPAQFGGVPLASPAPSVFPPAQAPPNQTKQERAVRHPPVGQGPTVEGSKSQPAPSPRPQVVVWAGGAAVVATVLAVSTWKLVSGNRHNISPAPVEQSATPAAPTPPPVRPAAPPPVPEPTTAVVVPSRPPAEAPPSQPSMATVPAEPDAEAHGSNTNSAPTGTLSVNVDPWAYVRVDGGRSHDTPFHMRLAAGEHRLVIQNPALKKRKELKVLVQPGQTKKIDLDLTGTDSD